jgi:ribose transport system ATP-binding protein
MKPAVTVQSSVDTGSVPRVRLHEITKSFGSVRALRGVSLDMMPSTIHGIVGQNGAGKSTLINILCGVVRPDHGTIELDGELAPVRSPEHARELGIQTIHQELHLVPSLTVAENVSLGVEPQQAARLLSRRTMAARAREALLILGRPDIAPSARVDTLTIGDQQVVEIARALRIQARLLILDEPTSALPAEAFQTLSAVLRRFRASGGVAIYVSHRFYEVLEICDTVSVLRDGALVGTVSPREVDEHGLAELTVGQEIGAVFPPRRRRQPEGARPPTLELRGVSGAVLRDLDLTVQSGVIAGVTGLEGSGIRELGRILAGDAGRWAGEIRLSGRRVRLRSPVRAARSGIAYVMSDRRAEGLFLTLAVRDNVAAPSLDRRRRFGFVDRRAEVRVVTEVLRRFDVRVSGLAQLAGTLSGGNQQKLLIARSLPLGPRLFVLDEPTRGVDVAARGQIYAELRALVDDGSSVLVISTDVQEVAGLCDEVVVLTAGGRSLSLTAPVDEAMLARAVSAEPTAIVAAGEVDDA